MPTQAETDRLIELVKSFVNRRAEEKVGSGLLYVAMMPREMKALRAALEPFQSKPST